MTTTAPPGRNQPAPDSTAASLPPGSEPEASVAVRTVMATGGILTGRRGTVRTGRRGRAVRAALALVAGLLGVAVGASPASAHAALVSSTPAQDALLQEAPNQVALTFTEKVNPVAGKVRVIAPDGTRVDRDEARPSGNELIIPLREVSQPGTYLVTFRVISADSHPVGGAFSFSYLQVSPDGPPTAESLAGASGSVLAALPVVRWIGYVGLLLLVGSGLVLALLWPHRLPTTDPLRVGYLAAGLVALGTIGELVLQVPYIAGSFGAITATDVREAFSSQYGAAHMVRLGVLVAAVVLLRAVARGRDWPGERVLLGVVGAIGIATWSISGHPSATTISTASIAADMMHVASMSVWLGGLTMLVLFLLPRSNAIELSAIVPVWSRWASYAVGLLLLTGLAQALLQVGTLDAVYDTTYGLVLLVKVGLVGAVLVAASFSRRMVPVFTPPEGAWAEAGAWLEAEPETAVATAPGTAVATALEPAPRAAHAGEAPPDGEAEAWQDDEVASRAARRLRRFVLVEAALALVVIGVTSVLVQLTPGRTETDSVSDLLGVQTVILDDQSGRFKLTVDLSPGKVGINDLHMYANTAQGQPVPIAEWAVKASNAAAGVDGLDVVVVPISVEHAIGQVTIPSEGSWRFTFTLRLDETTNGIVAADFTIRG